MGYLEAPSSTQWNPLMKKRPGDGCDLPVLSTFWAAEWLYINIIGLLNPYFIRQSPLRIMEFSWLQTSQQNQAKEYSLATEWSVLRKRFDLVCEQVICAQKKNVKEEFLHASDVNPWNKPDRKNPLNTMTAAQRLIWRMLIVIFVVGYRGEEGIYISGEYNSTIKFVFPELVHRLRDVK